MNVDFSDSLILVSGFTGFLGSNLTAALLEKGANVVGLQLRPGDKTDRPEAFARYANFHYKIADQNLEMFLARREWNAKHKAFFHFAGNASAADCQENPRAAYESNVQLTLQALECCRSTGVKAFIYPSTGYVYGNHLKNPATENNRLISTNIYTATKIAAEALIESYAHYHGFNCIIGRISNVYGSESSFETVTGNIIKSALLSDPIVLNTLKPVRDFIFIDDVINGFLAFIDRRDKKSCSYYNISTGKATSIRELAEAACDVFCLPKNNVITRNIEQYADTRLVLNCEKLKKEFGWQPAHSIKSGLQKILNGQ